MSIIHTIPVPIGWTPEQSFRTIMAGASLIHPLGPPLWANVLCNNDDEFIRVLGPGDRGVDAEVIPIFISQINTRGAL